MKRFRTGVFIPLFALVATCTLEPAGERWIDGFTIAVSKAEARRGRPLTPMSYAGVARRTSRQVVRRTAVRVSTLPRSCVYGSYYGGQYYNCSGVYYSKEGSTYVQIVIN